MNAALIIETRLISNVAEIINQHIKHLPGFELIIYHGRNNKHLFNEFDCQKKEVSINSLRDYNLFMTDCFLWKSLYDYNRVLIFQSDSMILRGGIDEFMHCDYVGAPWKFQYKGGNGGLSLRNPKSMLKTIEETKYNPSLGYEDVYFCNYLVGTLATREECERFSCETIFRLGTFGCHAINQYLTANECSKIRNQYLVYERS